MQRYLDFTDEQLVAHMRTLRFSTRFIDQQLTRALTYHRTRHNFFDLTEVIGLVHRVALKSDEQLIIRKAVVIEMTREQGRRQRRKFSTDEMIDARRNLKNRRVLITRAGLVARGIEVQNRRALEQQRRNRRTLSVPAFIRRLGSRSRSRDDDRKASKVPTMKYKNYTDDYLVQYIRKLEGLPEHAYRMSDADIMRCLRYHRARHTVFTPNVIDLLYKVAGKSNEQLDHRKYELIGMAIKQAGGLFTRDQMGKAWTHLKRHDIEITRINLVARVTQTRNQKLAQENERLERQRANQALIAYADFTNDHLIRCLADKMTSVEENAAHLIAKIKKSNVFKTAPEPKPSDKIILSALNISRDSTNDPEAVAQMAIKMGDTALIEEAMEIVDIYGKSYGRDELTEGLKRARAEKGEITAQRLFNEAALMANRNLFVKRHEFRSLGNQFGSGEEYEGEGGPPLDTQSTIVEDSNP